MQEKLDKLSLKFRPNLTNIMFEKSIAYATKYLARDNSVKVAGGSLKEPVER